jgi:hypothetical protein
MRPARCKQDPRVLVVVGFVELIEEAEIGVRQSLLVEKHKPACSDPQIWRQRLNEFFPAHRELALIAHAGREREPDPGREIGSDRNVRAPGAFDAVIIETVVMQQRAAAAEVAQCADCRGQLGW